MRSDVSTSPSLLDVVLENTPTGLCMFDRDRVLILCNAAYARLYDLPEELARPGTPLDAILAFRIRRENAPSDMESYFQVVEDARRQGAHAAQRIALQDGRTIQVTHNPMRDGGYVAIHDEVTDHVRAEAEVHHLATHDVLTGLPNRILFSRRLAEALERIGPSRSVAIHCLDLDRFKVVNDIHGHAQGDHLLRRVTDRFLSCMRPDDTVARLGGDEFVVLQTDVVDDDDASRLAERLLGKIRRPFTIDGHSLHIGVSVGSAIARDREASPDALLRNADLALYRAKREGRNTCRLFEPQMGASLRERRRLETDLRAAVASGAFALHYQPLVDARSGAITAFEALLRWMHPERGWVPPSDFIPIAEDIGLIDRIGAWALDQACADAVHWPEHVSVAVNLSSLQFRDGGVIRTVRAALAASGLSARRLELEITESVLLVEGESTLSTLHELRRMGVRIALDDFGTGYSSLGYLRRFPFDKIKIDQSFVRDMVDSTECAAIVKAVAALGTALGMTVVAEGVETQDQLDLVRLQGCTEIQGHYYAAAGSSVETLARIRSGLRQPVDAAST
ncbi:MAG: putative bifunctional diguanylate cyclase/phosphodiesterase [Janthinobacterium lividum]